MGASEHGVVAPEGPARAGPYIASFDLGTTTFRCFIYNSKARICGSAEAKVSNYFL